MSHKMQNVAVQCAHNALDVYIMNPDTETNIIPMVSHIHTNFSKRYRRGNWNCCVFKGFLAYPQDCKNVISFEVDNFGILIREALD